MELAPFLQVLSNNLPYPELSGNSYFKAFLMNQNFVQAAEFADQLVMTLPSPRIDWYSTSDFDKLQKGISQHVGGFVNAIGFYPVQVIMTLLSQMKLLNMIILLVSLVFNIILLVFIVISILLIYSLLMIGVETKTMETGIMRMVGISKNGLVSMIGIQSVMFVMPSVLAGFILSFLAIGACYTYIFQ